MFNSVFPISLIRKAFPALNHDWEGNPVIFFDGPGESQVPDTVLSAMHAYLSQYNSNLGGVSHSSKVTTDLMALARSHISNFIHAEQPDNIVFGANMTSLTFQMSRTIARDWQPDDEVMLTKN